MVTSAVVTSGVGLCLQLELVLGLLQHLAQLPLERGQIQPQLWPAAAIDLLQQPEAISS